MRKIKIVPGEYYHIYNRGNNKQAIFFDDNDWIRFLFLILHFRSPEYFYNLSRPISYFVRHRVFNIAEEQIHKILKNQYIELINFILMPNHFHLLVHERQEKGISRYMQRVLNAYAKYFNIKYKKTGHLFQGPYRAVRVKNNEQLLHLSAYIHRNCRELHKWKNHEDLYPWSSYRDYIFKNRWGKLLKMDIILDQFSNPGKYKNFVDTSGAKLKSELEKNIQLD